MRTITRQERIEDLSNRQLNRKHELRHRLTMMFIGGRTPSKTEMVEVERLREMEAVADLRAQKLYIASLSC